MGVAQFVQSKNQLGLFGPLMHNKSAYGNISLTAFACLMENSLPEKLQVFHYLLH